MSLSCKYSLRYRLKLRKKIDKSISNSPDTDRLSKKFEKKLADLVQASTPAELRDVMQGKCSRVGFGGRSTLVKNPGVYWVFTHCPSLVTNNNVYVYNMREQFAKTKV